MIAGLTEQILLKKKHDELSKEVKNNQLKHQELTIASTITKNAALSLKKTTNCKRKMLRATPSS